MTSTNDLLDLLSGLRAERRELEESIRVSLAEIDRDIGAVEHILTLLREYKGAPEPNGRITASDIAEAETQMDALVLIAEANDGVLVVTDAKRLFKEAGISTSKYISQAIYSKLARSDRFEYLAPGKARLVNPSVSDEVHQKQAELPV